MSERHQAALATVMEPDEQPLWVGQPGVGGLRFWALLFPVALAGAGIVWSVNAAMNFFADPLPDETLSETFGYFIAYITPRLAVFLGLPALYLIAAFWLLKRTMRGTRYLVTDRAAYIATGHAKPRARRYGISKLQRKTRWFTGTDLLFHFPAARMGSKGMYRPDPHGFKRLPPPDATAAMDALTPLLDAAGARQAAILHTLTKGRKT